MAIEVLLMDKVKDLGVEGDVVKVKDGYARNYLFPQNLAAPVTVAARAKLDKILKEREKIEEAELKTARDLAQKIEQASCTIAVKTGDDQQLYGSVGVTEILESLKDQQLDIDRHSINLDSPIKELGVFDVKVNLHPKVEATLKVWIVEE